MELVLVAGLFFILPLSLVIGLRANAGIMFFAACTGIVLLNSLDVTFVAAAGSVVPGDGESIVRLLVVLGAVFISALAFRHTVKGGALLFHIVLAGLLGATLWLELPALTGASWLLTTISERSWEILDAFQSPIIATGLALSLVLLLSKDHKYKKKSKH